MICHFSLLFFIKTKDENLSVFVCLFDLYLLKKQKKYSQHLSFFFTFLVKMKLWKIRQQVCHFSIFSFFEQNGKNEKMVRINIIFSFLCFSIFWEKKKNRKMIQDSYFSHFSNNIKKMKIAKYRFYPLTVFFVFLNLTSKLEK